MLEGVGERGELSRCVGLRLEEEAPVQSACAERDILQARRARAERLQPLLEQFGVLLGLGEVLAVNLR